MTDEIKQTESNLDIANYLEREVFTPALQQACRQSQETGATAADMINGVANAYSNMLSTLLGGSKAAADMMIAHANHLKSLDD